MRGAKRRGNLMAWRLLRSARNDKKTELFEKLQELSQQKSVGSGIKKIGITRSSILENERHCLFLQFVVIVISVLSFRSDIN